MKKIWIVFIMSTMALLYTMPAQADGITAVVLPNPIGLPEVIFVLGLLGFAIWKKSWIRIVLSTGIIIWGAFAMSYDIKIAAPLIAVGTVLFIQAILKQIQQAREATQ